MGHPVSYNLPHLDAMGNVFFARALEVVKSKTYDIRYPNLLARTFLPVDNQVDNAADTVTYRTFNQVGWAKVISNYADDLPRADVQGEETTQKIRGIGDSYGYNIQEIRSAQKSGTDLKGGRAASARKAIETLIDTIAAIGDTTFSLPGLLTNANATVYSTPNGAGGSATWALKTGQEIVADLVGIVQRVVDVTKGIHRPDTILVPETQYARAATTPWQSGSDVTALEFFRKQYPGVNTIASWEKLKTAGSGNTARMVAYEKSPDVLELIIPQEFEQFAPEPRNLEAVVPCHARVGGVLIYYPLAVAYGDGI